MPGTVSVELVQIDDSTSEAHIRQHTVRIDRPEAKGGANKGPMGGELFLAAIGGCFMSTLLAAIKARTAAVSHVRVAVVGTLADGPTRYEAVHVRVSAEGEARDVLEKLVDVADRGCIMTNTLRETLSLSVTLL